MDDRLEERIDSPCLQAQAPGLRLLRLPVVDTVYLSPLAFPENPYHRLVKDYKLVHDSLSDQFAVTAICICRCSTETGCGSWMGSKRFE